jgi:hypothetical protein
VTSSVARLRPVYLSEASLDLTPHARLAEAAENVFYALTDVGTVENEWGHHLHTTPVHEAGHAVAYVLAGRTVKHVRFSLFGIRRDALGECLLAGPRIRVISDMVEEFGVVGVTRYLVGTFAGPVAELRYDPRRVAGGHRKDKESAEKLCKALDYELGLAERFELHEWAWRETCRMFSDDRVWTATEEIANRLKQSRAIIWKVTGSVIHKIINRHLPNGWEWSEAPALAAETKKGKGQTRK